MFFSTNSCTKNGHDPFSFPPDHSFHLPISFFPFPSPFEVDQFDEYDSMFHQQQPHNFTSNSLNNAPIITPPPTDDVDKNPTTNMAILNIDQKKKIPRKRLSKKDRHSKITTARGLRDRRMRLSLPVARQFFGLQDMLGVDKGSKTVEWLLIQARPEILKLAKERNCCSLIMSNSNNVCSNSNSECDMVSGIDEVGVGGSAVDHHEENGQNFVKKMKSLKSDDKKKKRVKQPRKPMAKEKREMARAKARARTLKKNQIRDCSVSDFDFDNNHQNYTTNFNKISSCSWSSPFEAGEESGGTTHSYNNLNPAIEVEKPINSQFESSQSQTIIDYQLQNFSSFEIMAKWSPSDSTFNYLHQTQNLDLQDQNEFEDADIIFG